MTLVKETFLIRKDKHKEGKGFDLMGTAIFKHTYLKQELVWPELCSF